MELYENAVNHYIHRKADVRTQEWPLVHSHWNPFVAICVYIYFSWNARKLTAKMPTYQIRPLLIGYNAFMVAMSCYMCYEFFGTAIKSNYSWVCQPVDYTRSPHAMRMANVSWLYYVSKYIELFETVMFALRKKYNQITVLHVYHHTTMVFNWWLAVKYIVGGQAFIFGGINSFVHAVMYTYYGLAAIGPHMQKYLWWKRYLTKLQLTQFVILFFYCINSLIKGCKYPVWCSTYMVGYAVTLFALFANFYYQEYAKKKRHKDDIKHNGQSNGAIKRE